MKRDILTCSVSLMLLLFCTLMTARQLAPAFLPSSAVTEIPILILDAGHGGEDGGASTVPGQKESELNLSIVKKLEYLMAFLGFDTVLTRSTDISIHDEGCTTLRQKKISDLKNRAALINSISNSILISVHQNTFTDSRYHGAQVFFAQEEQSRQWGVNTQTLLQRILDPQNDRKAAPVPDSVYLFQHISCPAILVECGFLSNGEEAALLCTDSYQRKLSVVLAGAYLQQLQMIPSPLGGD